MKLLFVFNNPYRMSPELVVWAENHGASMVINSGETICLPLGSKYIDEQVNDDGFLVEVDSLEDFFSLAKEIAEAMPGADPLVIRKDGTVEVYNGHRE